MGGDDLANVTMPFYPFKPFKQSLLEITHPLLFITRGYVSHLQEDFPHFMFLPLLPLAGAR